MITGAHVLIWSQDADATRAFLRDVLELPHLDGGGGRRLFRMPPAEAAVHPTGDGEAVESGRHELHLMCDDIAATVEALRAKGVESARSAVGVTHRRRGGDELEVLAREYAECDLRVAGAVAAGSVDAAIAPRETRARVLEVLERRAARAAGS